MSLHGRLCSFLLFSLVIDRHKDSGQLPVVFIYLPTETSGRPPGILAALAPFNPLLELGLADLKLLSGVVHPRALVFYFLEHVSLKLPPIII